ncbi:hypothetical protein [Bordetella ansorpii]|uniref:hypothetical protein n=1 Tax=Bordetella ansorpii TaxID=288768 RepID=UPI0012E8C7BE|nr:hypothetical protein [Bordetella ansorpii]
MSYSRLLFFLLVDQAALVPGSLQAASVDEKCADATLADGDAVAFDVAGVIEGGCLRRA